MAHLEGFTKSVAYKMLSHYDDLKVRAKEPHIDSKKTKDNYNLLERDENKYIQSHLKNFPKSRDRLEFALNQENIKCQNRADVNVMCDWIITLPKNVARADEDKFFKYAYDFLKNEMAVPGAIIDAVVHKDETTPHLHFAFIPLVEATEKQKQKGYEARVCKKEYSSLKYLINFHKRFNKFCSDGLGYNAGITNGKIKEQGYNKSIKELKEEQKEVLIKNIELHKQENELMEQTQKDIDERQSKEFETRENRFKKDEIIISKDDYNNLINLNNSLETINTKLNNDNTHLKSQNKALNKKVDKLQGELEKCLKMPKKTLRELSKETLKEFKEEIKVISDERKIDIKEEIRKQEIEKKYENFFSHDIEEEFEWS